MSIDQTPSNIIHVLNDLRVESAEQFGQGACIHTGWVDTNLAQSLAGGVTDDRNPQQLVGILVQGEKVVHGVVIPIGIGRRQECSDIDWEARVQYVKDQLKIFGYGADST